MIVTPVPSHYEFFENTSSYFWFELRIGFFLHRSHNRQVAEATEEIYVLQAGIYVLQGIPESDISELYNEAQKEL